MPWNFWKKSWSDEFTRNIGVYIALKLSNFKEIMSLRKKLNHQKIFWFLRFDLITPYTVTCKWGLRFHSKKPYFLLVTKCCIKCSIFELKLYVGNFLPRFDIFSLKFSIWIIDHRHLYHRYGIGHQHFICVTNINRLQCPSILFPTSL